MVDSETKRQRLEAAGWTIGTVEGFLGLWPEETVFIEMKLALSKAIQLNLISQQMTQHALVHRVRASQSVLTRIRYSPPCNIPTAPRIGYS